MTASHRVRFFAPTTFVRRLATALVFLTSTGFGAAQDMPLKVAVYDAPPYGHVEPDGSIDGVSVDLWRRAAESLGREYRLVPVAQMEAILQGLERKAYDAAIGAITITPARLARVDFSYPTHRSGAAVAVRQDTGPMVALASYGSVLGELAPLIAFTFALLVLMGVAMWLAERPMRPHGHESVVDTLRDGIYWAVVTMTTVGYGDKTPKTTSGRVIAVVWMLASVALVSIVSASIVSRMTAERVMGGLRVTEADLAGKRLGAVAHSSGAEYLDPRHLRYAPFDDLAAALTALDRGQADAVINHRRAPVSGLHALQGYDQAAARRSRACLYGDRAAAWQSAQEAPRRVPGRDHRKPRVAPGRGQLFRASAIVTPWPAQKAGARPPASLHSG
jgi:ABC-type amino acid transport substrate-binding protein